MKNNKNFAAFDQFKEVKVEQLEKTIGGDTRGRNDFNLGKILFGKK